MAGGQDDHSQTGMRYCVDSNVGVRDGGRELIIYVGCKRTIPKKVLHSSASIPSTTGNATGWENILVPPVQPGR